MNVFYLYDDPRQSAISLVDIHTSKMIVESCQLLANAYPLDVLAHKDCPRTKEGNVRKYSYVHHPCTTWVRKSLSNFNWLLEHAIYLYEEKIYRKGGDHFCIGFLKWCFDNAPPIQDVGVTCPALAFKNYAHFQDVTNPTLSYRKFYSADKQYDDRGKYMALYTKRNPPDFWQEFLSEGELKVFRNLNSLT